MEQPQVSVSHSDSSIGHEVVTRNHLQEPEDLTKRHQYVSFPRLNDEEEDVIPFFEVGDHIYVSLEKIHMIQHHAIVLEVDNKRVTIADFTHVNEDTKALNFISKVSGTSTGSSVLKNDETQNPAKIISRRYLTREEARSWKKVKYGANFLQRCASFFPGTATAAHSVHPTLVVSRAKFIVSNVDLIPSYHVFKSNCECMAVWCKTGRWMTIQASTALHLFALSPIKASALGGTYVAAQTVAIPQAGIWGWMGYTTQVSLMSTQPWLLPAIIGGGAIMSIAPIVLLKKYERGWKKVENALDEQFWKYFWEAIDENLFEYICSFLFIVENVKIEDKKNVEKVV